MKKQEFIQQLSEILNQDEADLTESFKLNEENLDSLATISIIALVDQLYDKTVDIQKLSNCENLGMLFDLIENDSN